MAQDRKARLVGAGGSIMVHTLAVLLALSSPMGQGMPGKAHSAKNDVGSTLIAPKRLYVPTEAARGLPGDSKDGGSIHPVKDCPHAFYQGIGIQHNFQGQVIGIAPAGPAWEAGIRLGDTILNMHVLEGAGFRERGEPVRLQYIGGGTEKEIVIRARKICRDD